MPRPIEFNRDAAIGCALRVFQRKGYAAATTSDLLDAMQIGRQSLYDSFTDKRGLYLEALKRFHRERIATYTERLRRRGGLAGIAELLEGVAIDEKTDPGMGYLAVGAIAEFGTADPDVEKVRAENAAILHTRLVECVHQAKHARDVFLAADADAAARFVETTILGFQIAARAGMSPEGLDSIVKIAVRGLKY